MSRSNKTNPTWQCPICGDIRYETTKSSRILVSIKDDGSPEYKWIGKEHMCKGCSIVFRDAHLFNKSKIDKDKKHEYITIWE